MPFFVPRALQSIEENARSVAVQLIEELRERGRCEFVGDFAGTMPVMAFLAMMHLPSEHLPMLRQLQKNASKPHSEGSAESWAGFANYIRGWIDRRRAQPEDDPLSAAIHGQIDGQRMPDEDVFSMCLLLLTGGLDTVANMMSFFAHHMACNPDHQAQLRERPELIKGAVQELLRRYGISNVARLVSRDTVYNGVELRAGEMVLLPMLLAGVDERVTPDPLEVVLDRREPHHSTFGIGPHACPGRVLAQRELAIFLEEWLQRIPEFRIDPECAPVFTTGLVNGVEELHLVW